MYDSVEEQANSTNYIQVEVSSTGEDGSSIVSALSSYRLFSKTENGKIFFNTMTAIIVADHGVVKNILWDDGCYGCSSSCGDNSYSLNEDTQANPTQKSENCYIRQSECDSQSGNCDLQLYIVWSGSDSSGQVFHSSNLRRSRFQYGNFESNLQMP